jgi:hypothetical protein
MLDFKTPRSRLRLYAAAWTAAVAAIPAYIAAGTGSMLGAEIVPERLPLTLLAILAAGISGYWIGWRLIDPNGDCDSLVAPFLGAAICLLAYYLLGVLVAVPETVQTMAAHNTFTPLFLLLAPLAASPWIFVGAPYFVLRYGIPLTWYTFPVACIAGFVLSFCYRRRRN